jgi:hypothetical protein
VLHIERLGLAVAQIPDVGIEPCRRHLSLEIRQGDLKTV